VVLGMERYRGRQALRFSMRQGSVWDSS
jgi:hypothetical protein